MLALAQLVLYTPQMFQTQRLLYDTFGSGTFIVYVSKRQAGVVRARVKPRWYAEFLINYIVKL